MSLACRQDPHATSRISAIYAPADRNWHVSQPPLTDLTPAVASLCDQIERLSEHASPCRYIASVKWAAMRANALAFRNQHRAKAYRLGWTAPQLFGLYPQHGTLRVDYCGALTVGGTPARGVEANRVLVEQTAAYRDRQGQVWGVPV